MNFYRLWRSFKSKRNSSQRTLDFDLFSQLSYMSAIAEAGVDRHRFFEYASQFPCSIASYFRDIHLLAEKLNYDYAEACRIIGQSTKEDEIRSLLLRFSAALSSGEREEEFLTREARVQAEAYSNKYQRDLERLGAWTYAFVGLIVSVTLILIIALISSMIFPAGADVTLFVTVVMGVVMVGSLFGAWVIYQTAPREIKIHSSPQPSREQRLNSTIFKVLLPASIALGVVMAILHVDIWIILLVCGGTVFPIGLASLVSDRRVDRRDKETGTFFRSLGGITTAIGIGVKEGLDKLDMRPMPSLLPYIERLRNRLGLGLKPEICWQSFSAETGSEAARRSSQIFYDATSLGGDAERVGEHASFFTTTLHLLRARRKLLSSTYRWLSVGMHAILVALLVFIVELICYFAEIVQGLEQEMEMGGAQEYLARITGDIFLFNFSVAESFRILIIPAILVLSVVNAFVSHTTEGGHWYKFFFYWGITLALSGLFLWGVPILVNFIFAKVG